MEGVAHDPDFARKLGIPQRVGKEFIAADGAKIAAGIIFVSPDGEVLLLKRAGEEGVDNYVGHWALPGGGAEDGETPEQAADREASEELGGAAPVGRKRLIDRKVTPNGMVFHTFAQPVDTKFTPTLNEEHSKFGWFRLDELPGDGNDLAPEPMHPAVKAVLSDGLGMAEDMEPEDWTALRENFAKWTREEESEPEHQAEDDQPQLATTGNTGIPLAAWNKKRKAKLAQDAICRGCGGSGCVKCGGSGVSPLTKAPMKPGLGGGAFDMALFMRDLLAADAEFNEGDHPRAPDGKFGSAGSSAPAKPLSMASIKKTGGKLGSNEGGTYEGAGGAKYYIKKAPSRAHADNEKTAARLYQLAGAKTLSYREVEGGQHVATEWKQLEKKNIKDFTPAERKEAARDFAIHAWLSNWDAAGLGGDNQGVLEGKTTTLDVGGSLRFRAQGSPKGDKFGDKVIEFDSLRDKGMNPDAAKLFAPMTEDELTQSVKRVTKIPDAKIRETVGDDKELADRLIARKKDLAKRSGLKAMDGMFMALDSRKEPEHTLLVRYDGDFRFNSFFTYLRKLGSQGSSRSIGDLDNPDGGEPEHFYWDGDGADKIWDAEIDGEKLAFDRAMVAGVDRHGLAFDRAPVTVRRIDEDGRMHVEVSNISKATINPYLGKEIPKYRELGLDPNRIYQLLRDPAELKKAESTFNNLPLLDEHVGVNAASHRPEHVIGSTGTDAAFEHPHLKNSLVIWADRGIKAVESERKKQLSSAYRYRADMTPGMYEGKRYDGVMRDLVGNHVALVQEGRAGSDVVVGDGAIDPWSIIESAILGLERFAA